DRAFTRILLGGLMQHSRGEAELEALFVRCVEVTSQGLSEELVKLLAELHRGPDGWLVLWASSKSALELFDGIDREAEWDPSVSELSSILYGPILVCQNLDAEVEEEGFSDSFREKVVDPRAEGKIGDAQGNRLLRSIEIFEQLEAMAKSEEEAVRTARR